MFSCVSKITCTILAKCNSLPNYKISESTKFKSFAEGKTNVTKIKTSLLDTVETIVGKEENAGYQHVLFPQCFQNAFSKGC